MSEMKKDCRATEAACQRKNLYVLSGPSGSGKTTVFERLKVEMPEIQRGITCTTRLPRANETDGVDYYFLTEKEFLSKSRRKEFVESNRYDDCYYGTLRSEICRHSEEFPLFLIIDTNGKAKVLKEYPNAVSIFIKPPSEEEMIRRLRDRGANTEAEMERRIAEAKKELTKAPFYDFVCTNTELEVCVAEIREIVRKTVK